MSYSTLYGRYRECHGYLRHAWTRTRDRTSGNGEWWNESYEHPHENNERSRKESNTPIIASEGVSAEELVIEVDSYDITNDDAETEKERTDNKESIILSIRHGKVQRKRVKDNINNLTT